MLQFNFSRTGIAQIHRSASFYCKALDSKYLRFCRPDGFCHNYSTQPCSANVDNTNINGRSCDPIKLYRH